MQFAFICTCSSLLFSYYFIRAINSTAIVVHIFSLLSQLLRFYVNFVVDSLRFQMNLKPQALFLYFAILLYLWSMHCLDCDFIVSLISLQMMPAILIFNLEKKNNYILAKLIFKKDGKIARSTILKIKIPRISIRLPSSIFKLLCMASSHQQWQPKLRTLPCC